MPITFGTGANLRQPELLPGMPQNITGANVIPLTADMSSYTQLADGSFVSNAEFNKLSATAQAQLKQLGVDGFNSANAKANAEQSAIFQQTHVRLNDGTYVGLSEYSALTGEQQGILVAKGVEGFNTEMKTIQEASDAAYAGFTSSNTQLASGEWVSNDYWNSLDQNEQSKLNDMGITVYTYDPANPSGAQIIPFNLQLDTAINSIVPGSIQQNVYDYNISIGKAPVEAYNATVNYTNTLNRIGNVEHIGIPAGITQEQFVAGLPPILSDAYNRGIAAGGSVPEINKAVIDLYAASQKALEPYYISPTAQANPTTGIIRGSQGGYDINGYIANATDLATAIQVLQAAGYSNIKINNAINYATATEQFKPYNGDMALFIRDNPNSGATQLANLGYTPEQIKQAQSSAALAPNYFTFVNQRLTALGYNPDTVKQYLATASSDTAGIGLGWSGGADIALGNVASNPQLKIYQDALNKIHDEYISQYGTTADVESIAGTFGTLPLGPAAKVFLPDVTINQIRGYEWALSAGQILTAGSLAAGSNVVGTILNKAGQAAFGAYVLLDWDNMSASQQAISIAALVLPNVLEIVGSAAGKAAQKYVKELTPAENIARSAKELSGVDVIPSGTRVTTEVLGSNINVAGEERLIGEVISPVANTVATGNSFVSKLTPELKLYSTTYNSAISDYADAYAQYQYIGRQLETMPIGATRNAAESAYNNIAADLPGLRQNVINSTNEFNVAISRTIDGSFGVLPKGVAVADALENTISNTLNPTIGTTLESQVATWKQQLSFLESVGNTGPNYINAVKTLDDLNSQLEAFRVGDYPIVRTELAVAKSQLSELLSNPIPDIDMVTAKRNEIVKLQLRLDADKKAIIGIRQESGGISLGGSISRPPELTPLGGGIYSDGVMTWRKIIPGETLPVDAMTMYTPTGSYIEVSAGSKMSLVASDVVATVGELSTIQMPDIEIGVIPDIEIGKSIPEIAVPAEIGMISIEEQQGRQTTAIPIQFQHNAPVEFQSVGELQNQKQDFAAPNAQIQNVIMSVNQMQGATSALQGIKPITTNAPETLTPVKPELSTKPQVKSITEEQIKQDLLEDVLVEEEILAKESAGIKLTKKDQKKLKDLNRRKAFNGAISFQHGFGFVALKEPYYPPEENIAFFYGHPPPGAQVVEGGKGAAYRSIQMYLQSHDLPDIHFKRGIMKIHISKGVSKTPGATGAITFETTQRGRDTGEDLDIQQVDLKRIGYSDEGFADTAPTKVPQMQMAKKVMPQMATKKNSAPSGFELR